MKKLIVLLASVLLVVGCLCGCDDAASNTDATEDGVLTEVYDDSGALTGYERRYHDASGNLSRLDVYDKNNVYDHFVLYAYDDNNRLTQETYYRADGIGDHYYTYAYDDEDHLIEKAYVMGSGGIYVTRYDADGNEIETMEYDEHDVLVQHRVLTDGVWETVPVTEPDTENE